MKEYKIEITETLQKRIIIKASNIKEALLKAEELYKDGKIILDDTSYVDTDFDIIED